MSYLCLLADSGVQHIVMVFLCNRRFVFLMFPASLDCPFFIAPLLFSNVY